MKIQMRHNFFGMFFFCLLSFTLNSQSVGIPYVRVGLGVPLPVEFSNASGVGGSWIGLYRQADGDGAYLRFQYINDQVNGRITFEGIQTEGVYNFRLFQGNGYQKIATSPSFQVVRGMIIDSTFGQFGSFHWDASGTGSFNGAVAARMTSDGKILLAGSVKNGKVSPNGTEAVDFTLIRLGADGLPDSKFGNQGKVVITPRSSFFPVYPTACKALALQEDGKIIIGGDAIVYLADQNPGYLITMVRINMDGTVDPTFADSGTLIHHFIYDGEKGKLEATDELKCIEVMADGKIVVGGGSILSAPFAPGRPFIGRFLSNGMYDGSFGAVGIITPLDSFNWRAYVESIVPDPSGDGGFHAVATARAQFGFNHQILYKFDNKGQYDPVFGGGKPIVERRPGVHNETYSRKMIRTEQGDLLYQGGSHIFFLWAAKISPETGAPVLSFGDQGLAQCDPGEIEVPGGMFADRDQIYLAYTGNGRQLGMARLNGDGSPDVVFGYPFFEFKDNSGSFIEYQVSDLIRQGKNRYIMTGWARHYNPPHYETFAYAFKDNPAVFTSVKDEQGSDQNLLLQNYPNPFEKATTIPFHLTQTAEVSIELYDMQGVRLGRINQGTLEQGNHEVILDSRLGFSFIPGGHYLYSLIVRQGLKIQRLSRVMQIR